jgi:hypothetical protein
VAPFDFAPRFTGPLPDYGFPSDFQGIKGKTGTVLRACGTKRRGVTLRVTEDGGFGFFQVFPDATRLREPFAVTAWLDLASLGDAVACLELDSPFVPIGTAPDPFAAFCAQRLPDDSVRLFAATEAGNRPELFTLPPGTPGVALELLYDLGQVDVAAAACGPTSVFQSWIEDLVLASAGSAGLGFGTTLGAKGDAVGLAFEVSGDVHADARQDVLEDLQAAIDLENAALADLGNGMAAEAREKIEQARRRIEVEGPQVPGSDPPEFEPPLLEKVGALTDVEPEVRADVQKRLQKAAARDAKARDKIDRGRPADLKEAQKQLEKAVQDKLRAKAVLETGVVAEGKGAL